MLDRAAESLHFLAWFSRMESNRADPSGTRFPDSARDALRAPARSAPASVLLGDLRGRADGELRMAAAGHGCGAVRVHTGNPSLESGRVRDAAVL